MNKIKKNKAALYILLIPTILSVIFIPLVIIAAEGMASFMGDAKFDYKSVVLNCILIDSFLFFILINMLKRRTWAFIINLLILFLINVLFIRNNVLKIVSVHEYEPFLDLSSINAFGDSLFFYILMLILNIGVPVTCLWLTLKVVRSSDNKANQHDKSS